MGASEGRKQNLALVFGSVPTVEEIDQFKLITGDFDVTVVSSESICGFLTQTSWFNDLKCIALPDYDESPTYLPGLEKVVSKFDVVVVKERLGLYAYQVVKAKLRSKFRLAVWVDNLIPFAGEDINQMRTIRTEVSNAADAFIVQSNAARETLLLEGIEEQRIHYFAPWVESHVKRSPKARAKALETLGLTDTDFVVAHFGQVEFEEGLFDLVHAAKRAIAWDPTVSRRLKLVFCGIGSLSTDLRDRLVMLGIDRRAVFVAPSRDAYNSILLAADCLFYSVQSSRDRLEGDPYRLVMAMGHEIPVLASRSPIVEEYVGKHRIDFCPGSVEGLADAIIKATDSRALLNNVAKKCTATFTSRFARDKSAPQMRSLFSSIAKTISSVDPQVLSIENLVSEVESKVLSKQYLVAIDLIESIIAMREVPVHHTSNLYRLIGDCFAKLGDSETAKASYVKAVELDPYATKAYIGLGTVGLIRNSFDIAVLQFQKAVSLSPDDEMANLGLGLAFQGMSELKEANRWVIESLNINPENSAALFTLVKIAYDRNEFTDAEASVSKYLSAHPNDRNMAFTQAGLLFKLNKINDAKAICNRLLEVDPGDQRASSLMAQIREVTAAGASSSNG